MFDSPRILEYGGVGVCVKKKISRMMQAMVCLSMFTFLSVYSLRLYLEMRFGF